MYHLTDIFISYFFLTYGHFKCNTRLPFKLFVYPLKTQFFINQKEGKLFLSNTKIKDLQATNFKKKQQIILRLVKTILLFRIVVQGVGKLTYFVMVTFFTSYI